MGTGTRISSEYIYALSATGYEGYLWACRRNSRSLRVLQTILNESKPLDYGAISEELDYAFRAQRRRLVGYGLGMGVGHVSSR